ncbi:MAG: PorV/PorQ family protein [Elusimicrobia bacterium]|nr:PorV/PorQ family protein [Elusimicrobiota bacterium]
MRRSILAALLGAQAAAGAAAPGKASLEFLRLDIGPRQVGMGQAGVALGGDPYAAAYNPALLASLRSRELAVSHVEWLPGIRYQDYLYAHPTRAGSFGARLQRLDYGEIAAYDAVGARSGQVTASDLLAGFGYARRFFDPGVSLGASAKLARESLAGVAAQAWAFDLGASWTPRAGPLPPGTTCGLAARNVGPSVRFDHGSAPLPLDVAVGASAPLFEDSLSLALDLHLPGLRAPRANAGAEYRVAETVTLRAGVEVPQAEGPGLRAGIGFRLRAVRVDYAFSPMGALGHTHHMGLSIPFGGASEAAHQRGLALLRQGQYDDAILKFNEALTLDPRNVEANRMLRRAYELLRRHQEPDKP